MCRSLSDQIRAVLKARPGAAGHRWIHSDRVVRVRLQATGFAAKATGDLNQVMPVFGQACLAIVPIQTLSAGNDTRQRSRANRRPSLWKPATAPVRHELIA
jgi:hypothetical protein